MSVRTASSIVGMIGSQSSARRRLDLASDTFSVEMLRSVRVSLRGNCRDFECIIFLNSQPRASSGVFDQSSKDTARNDIKYGPTWSMQWAWAKASNDSSDSRISCPCHDRPTGSRNFASRSRRLPSSMFEALCTMRKRLALRDAIVLSSRSEREHSCRT